MVGNPTGRIRRPVPSAGRARGAYLLGDRAACAAGAPQRHRQAAQADGSVVSAMTKILKTLAIAAALAAVVTPVKAQDAKALEAVFTVIYYDWFCSPQIPLSPE